MIAVLTSRTLGLPSLLAAVMAAGVCAQAQQAAGDLEKAELKAQVETSGRLVTELEAKLAAEKNRNSSLTQSLASANGQATQARESYERLRGLLEGLGVGALEGSTDQLQDRLLAALKDMRLMDEQKRKVTEALMSLSEASLAYVKTAPSADPEAKRKLDQALQNGELAARAASMTGADGMAGDLHNARVVSYKDEQGVVLLNLGARDGVKVGMPFSIFREDRPIAKALVVEVRKSVCGAVVQEVVNNKVPVQVGDRGRVAIDRSFQ